MNMSPNAWLGIIVAAFWIGLALAVKKAKPTTSLVPIIPLVPAALFGLGVIINTYRSPWGTAIVGGIHVALLLLILLMTMRWRREEKQKLR